ncbi:MAG: OmpA family protein [Woeseiaceae bacterium]|nr:OmpA family protein [Woeseiaceae bacterium]
MRAGRAPTFVVLFITGAGLLVSGPTAEQTLLRDAGGGPYPTLAAPAFDAELKKGELTVTGETASTRHDAALRAALGDTSARTDLVAGILLPDYWPAGTLALLGAVRALDAGGGSMTTGSVELRGVTTAPARLEARLDALRAVLPDGIELRDETIRLPGAESLAALCARTFAALADETIEFERSRATLRPSAHAQLDRLAEFAFDCPGQRIRITGHTDASGARDWNLELSRLRAEAVADDLVRRGIAAERFVVAAKGAAEPVADNATALGRRLNRRIEFALDDGQSPAGAARLSAEKSSTSKTSVEPGGITLPTARSP